MHFQGVLAPSALLENILFYKKMEKDVFTVVVVHPLEVLALSVLPESIL
jgi:hypothetical protein